MAQSVLYQFFLVSSQQFFKNSPDFDRDGSFRSFYVKVQIIYHTEKLLVMNLQNIPM